VTITEIADGHAISRSHLNNIVHQLGAQGLLETTRGRGGGMRLSKPAKDTNVDEVVRETETETDFAMVECFEPDSNQCCLSQHCRLKGVLHQATSAYLAVLDGVTLADLIAPKKVTIQMPGSKKIRATPELPT
jgi:Rrf2 family nitric oxide-sensitive transcriptional repressor